MDWLYRQFNKSIKPLVIQKNHAIRIICLNKKDLCMVRLQQIIKKS